MKIYRLDSFGGNTTPVRSWLSTPYTVGGQQWQSGYKEYANGGVFLYRRPVIGTARMPITSAIIPMMPVPIETYMSKDVDITIGYISCLDEVRADWWVSDSLTNIDNDTVFFDNDDLQKNPLAKAIEDGVFSADGVTAGDISEMEIRMTFHGQMAGTPIPSHKEIGWLKGWSIVDVVGETKPIRLTINVDLEAFVSNANGSLKTGRYSLCVDENGLHEDVVYDGISTNIAGRLFNREIVTSLFSASFDLDVSDVLDEEDPDDDIDYPDDDIIEDPVSSPFKGSADPYDIYRIEKVDVREPFNPVDCSMHIQRETPSTFPVVGVEPGRAVYYALAADCTPLVSIKNGRQSYAAADIVSGKPSHAAVRAARGSREGAWFVFTPFRNLKPDESSNETK